MLMLALSSIIARLSLASASWPSVVGMNTFTLGLRNAFRNVVRSVSIITILGISIGLCLTMLIAYQAVGQKISDLKSTLGNTITISLAGFRSDSDANNELTTEQLARVKSLSHVARLTEALDDRLTTTGSASFGPSGDNASTTSLQSPVTLGQNGGGVMFRSRGGSLPANFSLPIPVLGTTDPSSLNGTSLTFKSGSQIDGNKDADSALISTDMATKNNLKVGSTFTAYDTTLTVAGIFDSGTRGGNNTVIMALPTVQRLSAQGSNITSAVATVDSADNLSSSVAAVKNALGSNV